jgi:hypothetical protein
LIKEETGLKTRLGKVFGYEQYYSPHDKKDFVCLLFIADHISGEIKKSSEHELVGWYEMDALPRKMTPWVKKTVEKAVSFRGNN